MTKILAAPPPIRKPDANFVRSHPAHFIALGFGTGLAPFMPGTWGTLFAWLSYFVLSTYWGFLFTSQVWGWIIGLGIVLGSWCCAKTSHDLGKNDHGSIVWDEIIAFWLVLWLLMPASAAEQFAAFICFRFFDMVKPPPIRQIERQIKGGFGVMADDLAAAFFTLLCMALWRTVQG